MEREKKEFIARCENGTTMAMQSKA